MTETLKQRYEKLYGKTIGDIIYHFDNAYGYIRVDEFCSDKTEYNVEEIDAMDDMYSLFHKLLEEYEKISQESSNETTVQDEGSKGQN